MIRLFTTWYDEVDEKRRSELIKCLEYNIQCPSIHGIVVLAEGEGVGLIRNAKIDVRRVDIRPNYDDFFDVVNAIASCEDISMVANTDIYFDETISAVEQVEKSGQCFALSRWDVRSDGNSRLHDRNDSQDVWIFRGPIRNIRGDFPLGVPRCDNRLLYEIQESGYQVRNPAFSIRTHHLHAGSRGEYPDRNLPHFVDPPYRYLYPHNLLPLPQTLWHNLRHPDSRISWRFDRRQFERWLPVRVLRRVSRILKGADDSA